MPDNETNFEREVLDRLKTIEVKIDNYDKVKEQVYQNQRDILKLDNYHEAHDKAIKELQESNKWLSRTIAAAIITGIVGIVVIFIRIGIGL